MLTEQQVLKALYKNVFAEVKQILGPENFKKLAAEDLKQIALAWMLTTIVEDADMGETLASDFYENDEVAAILAKAGIEDWN